MANLNLKNKSVLKRPRITEKAVISADKHRTYAFEVEKSANKASVAASVKAQYKVTPIKIRIVNIPAKRVFVRGKRGMKSGMKKAYVQLKQGDKIELV